MEVRKNVIVPPDFDWVTRFFVEADEIDRAEDQAHPVFLFDVPPSTVI